MKYRKKPVVVEAIQYFRRNESIEPQASWPSLQLDPNNDKDFVTTIHDQRSYVVDGDWLILEPDGMHSYPCKADIFEATYEPAS